MYPTYSGNTAAPTAAPTTAPAAVVPTAEIVTNFSHGTTAVSLKYTVPYVRYPSYRARNDSGTPLAR